MTDDHRRFSNRPRGIAILAFSHLLLGAACLYILLAFGLVRGFWESVALGFGMMGVGAVSSGILTHINGRMKWLWIVSFSVLPFVYVIPSYLRYVEIGDPYPLKYWISFPITVVLACYLGASLCEVVVWKYRFWKPTRKRYLRRILRWLS